MNTYLTHRTTNSSQLPVHTCMQVPTGSSLWLAVFDSTQQMLLTFTPNAHAWSALHTHTHLFTPTPPCMQVPIGSARIAVFDSTQLVSRKFKPLPETTEEARECKQPLTPKELMSVTGGPKTIDFGTVSVFTGNNSSKGVLCA